MTELLVKPKGGRYFFTKPIPLLFGLILVLGCLFMLWIGIQTIVFSARPQVPVLLYHDFTLEDTLPPGNQYLTSQEVFEAEMQFLQDHGYQVISLRQLINHMQFGGELPPKPVVITFDDGYYSNYMLAYPILRKHQMPATIFLMGARAGQQLEPDILNLSWEQMREMEQSGLIDIQAHTYDLHHSVFVDATQRIMEPAVMAPAYRPEENRIETVDEYKDKLLADFKKEKEIIEANLGLDSDRVSERITDRITETEKVVEIMSWPYGAYNLTSLKLARQAGFKHFVVLDPGMNQCHDQTIVIRRISVDGNISLEQFAARLEPDHCWVKGFWQVLKRYRNQLIELYTRKIG